MDKQLVETTLKVQIERHKTLSKEVNDEKAQVNRKEADLLMISGAIQALEYILNYKSEDEIPQVDQLT